MTCRANHDIALAGVKALKYVSFPVQTLAKSGKMIPVMVSKCYSHSLAKAGCLSI